jgi:hypothetical protein
MNEKETSDAVFKLFESDMKHHSLLSSYYNKKTSVQTRTEGTSP